MAKVNSIIKCESCNNLFTKKYKQQIFCSNECRFWSKVNITDINNCWIWNASFDSKNYGQFRLNKKELRAHRLSYSFWYKVNIDCKHILHKCDNTKCCNPYHLYEGSHQDNMNDIVSRKRAHKGYKLNINDVKQIKELLSNGYKQHHIAKIFNIQQSTVSRINNNLRWQRFI